MQDLTPDLFSQIDDSLAGTTFRNYDGLNRLTSETTSIGTVSYTYDAAGRRTSMSITGQPLVSYAYDDANRLTQITKDSDIVSFTYDAAGRRSSLTLPNGILVEYNYDVASRLTAITYKKGTNVLGDLTYEYDKAGNRTKTGGTFARTGLPGAIATAAYNAANQQTALGDKTLTYDDNGNLLSMTDATGTTDYTWNARNQLTGINGPGVTASFVYDASGRRQQKTINANSTEFLYDGANPVQELSGASVLANILPGLRIDEFLAREDVVAGLTDYFLPDALGSATALADGSGTVQTEYTYEPFGKTAFSGTSSTNPFQYTGRENDGSDLYYYRFRYYHPDLQRFISEDPIEFYGGDINLFAYVKNSPQNLTDPWGLFHRGNQSHGPVHDPGDTEGVGGIAPGGCANFSCVSDPRRPGQNIFPRPELPFPGRRFFEPFLPDRPPEQPRRPPSKSDDPQPPPPIPLPVPVRPPPMWPPGP